MYPTLDSLTTGEFCYGWTPTKQRIRWGTKRAVRFACLQRTTERFVCACWNVGRPIYVWSLVLLPNDTTPHQRNGVVTIPVPHGYWYPHGNVVWPLYPVGCVQSFIRLKYIILSACQAKLIHEINTSSYRDQLWSYFFDKENKKHWLSSTDIGADRNIYLSLIIFFVQFRQSQKLFTDCCLR